MGPEIGQSSDLGLFARVILLSKAGSTVKIMVACRMTYPSNRKSWQTNSPLYVKTNLKHWRPQAISA